MINDGLIAGGWSWGGGMQANAIEFYNGGNDLELWSNFEIQGDVIATRVDPGTDTFALGGTDDGSFNVSLFGVQYQGFNAFEKRGSSLWTLMNTSTELTPWKLLAGTLSVSEEGNLGDLAGGVTFDGGTLQITGTSYTTTPRDLTILENGGSIDIDHALNVFTINQAIVGGVPNSGGLWKLGDGTLILNGVNTYAGWTDVMEGTLVLGDTAGPSTSVLGHAYVAPDATLAGHGTIGGDLHNEGTVSPGYSYGILTVNGSYEGNGSVLNIQLADHDFAGDVLPAGQGYDQLAVGGTVWLEGTTLRLEKFVDELGCGNQAAVILAGNGFVGQVDLFDITDFDNRMFFDNGTSGTGQALVYGTDLAQDEDLSHIAGLNANEQAVAKALSDDYLTPENFVDHTDPLGAAVIAVIEECGGAGDVFDHLSPESDAGFIDYTMHVTRNYTRTAMNMPGSAPVAPAQEPISEKGAKGAMAKGVIEQPAPAGRYTTVFGGFSHYDVESDSSSNGHDYDIESNGGIVGIRHTMNALTFGGFLGYDEGDVSSRFLNSDVEGWVLGGFASYMLNQENNVTLSGGMTYGSYEFDGTRITQGGVASFSGVESDALDIWAAIQGDVWQTDKLRLSPSLGLHYIQADADSIVESGAGTSLTVRGQDEEALLAELELKLEYQAASNFLVLGSVGYTHNFMDADRDLTASFNAGGTPFTVTAPGLGDHSFSAGIGAVWHATEALSFGANYHAEFGSDIDMSNSVGIGASYSF